MPIVQAVPLSLLIELGQGVHNWTTDTFVMALYLDSANLGPNTTGYTTSGEVPSGNGYTTGGRNLVVNDSGSLDGNVAVFNWDDLVWPNATFTSAGSLAFNASKSNRAIGVYDFGGNVTGQGGDFILRMPPKTAAQAVFRIEG